MRHSRSQCRVSSEAAIAFLEAAVKYHSELEQEGGADGNQAEKLSESKSAVPYTRMQMEHRGRMQITRIGTWKWGPLCVIRAFAASVRCTKTAIEC